MDGQPHTRARAGHAVAATMGWGFYLAVSWTWVIGMVLPALLLRDFGWWSLAVFLVPNAIGAALMGTVLRDAKAAERLRHTHDRAIRLFSVVTIAFHLYVLAAVALALDGLAHAPGGAGVLILAAVVGVLLLAVGRWLVAAAVVWLASVVLAIAYATGEPMASLAGTGDVAAGAHRDLLLLTPVVVFGFALCPYLDATFLRARMSTGPAAGRAAFAFGFFGPFAVMIAFTALYAGAITSGNAVGMPLVLAHLALQAGFTLAAHLREAGLTPVERGITLGIALAAIAGAWILPAGPIAWADGMRAWEVVYRLFMAAYGLLFPAYVLYAVVPGWLGLGPLPRMGRAVAVLTIAAVLPMYALGFIAREEQWLPLALGLVLGGAFATFAARRVAARGRDG